MSPLSPAPTPEPFGKQNVRTVKKPALAKPRKHKRTPPPTKLNAKLYLYVAGGILFVVLAGYALSPSQVRKNQGDNPAQPGASENAPDRQGKSEPTPKKL
jgi:hypothetical protein